MALYRRIRGGCGAVVPKSMSFAATRTFQSPRPPPRRKNQKNQTRRTRTEEPGQPDFDKRSSSQRTSKRLAVCNCCEKKAALFARPTRPDASGVENAR